MLHFSRVVGALSFREAHARLAPAIDAMHAPRETIKNPLCVEPCGADGRSYRHRAPRCASGVAYCFDAARPGWITALSSLDAHAYRGDRAVVGADHEVDPAALARRCTRAAPDPVSYTHLTLPTIPLV